MSFSSGTFTLAAGNPVTTLTTISSSWANTTLSDIATGLSSCVLKDGTQTFTANLPMSGFKLTGLGAGAAAGDSLRYEQLFTTGTVSLLGALFVTAGLNTSKAAAITATATIALGSMTGNYAVITGTNTITSFDATAAGVLRVVEFSGAPPITHNATSMILPNATSIVAQAGQCALVVSENSGNWRWLTLTPSKQPTRQTLITGTAATYTTPVGATRINVRAVGGGGGGFGSAGGGAGTASTFAGGAVAMSAGGGPTGTNGGLASTAAATASGGDINLSGGAGQSGVTTLPAATYGQPGSGGNGAFGGGGAGGASSAGPTVGLAGSLNTGGGGGGGGSAATFAPGGGGGSGAYCELLIKAPQGTYTYTVGASGAGGVSDANHATGGAGAVGIIIVDEWYD